MRQLLLLRHAKAVSYAAGGDFERALNDRGRREAIAVGAYMRDHVLFPEAALISPARRTRETFDLLNEALGRQPPATRDPSLYNAEAGEIAACISATTAEVATLLVIGHNPGLAELAMALGSRGEPSVRTAMQRHFPPASLAVLSFDCDAWTEIGATPGVLAHFVTPDMLPDSQRGR